MDFDLTLQDDRSVIVFVVYEMHRAAGDFFVSLQDGFVDMVSIVASTAIRWYQRRMDVHYAVFEIAGNEYVFEEPSHHDQVDLALSCDVENAVTVSLG